MNVAAVIDYGSGNIRSVEKACACALKEAEIDAKVVCAQQAETVLQADWIVLPGVGAFADCKSGLEAIPGMIEALSERVQNDGRPFLGICVGMQLLATQGHEHNITKGLDWISGRVRTLDVSSSVTSKERLKLPHMGWNRIDQSLPHPVVDQLAPGAHMYFVHSYIFESENKAHCLARSTHGERFAAIVGRDNILGTQFHPEKSQRTGLSLLKAFFGWRP